MQFDELTLAQQATYLAFMLLFRPMVGRIENVNLWIEYLVTLWTTEVQPIHAMLDVSAVIPDNTGYPNATDVTKSDVNAALQLLQDVFVLHTAANSTLAVKMVGPENIIQQVG